jgi:hypothetical protein
MKQFTRLILTSVAVVFLVAASADGALVGDATCAGGSIASGVYSNLNIAGACSLNAGSVIVEHKLTVLPGASLVAAFSGSDMTVGGDVDVQANSVLIMGCEPIFFTCFNDPTGTLSTTDTVNGTLTAENALVVIVHNTTVGHNVSVSEGGGGVSCAPSPSPVLAGAPNFGDFEDNMIGGNLTITGWHSCWLGALRNLVRQNINFHGNVTADPDGNEIANNSIGRNLNCTGNSPSPQIGDSGGGPNTVFGRANGQCANPTLLR